jgi:hypothetical protein
MHLDPFQHYGRRNSTWLLVSLSGYAEDSLGVVNGAARGYRYTKRGRWLSSLRIISLCVFLLGHDSACSVLKPPRRCVFR